MARTKIQKYDENGNRLQNFDRGKFEIAEPGKCDDLTAVVNIGITALKRDRGRMAAYPDNQAGLDLFISKSIEYLEHVNSINSNPEMEKAVFPDIESWATFLGISRMTLSNYFNERGEDWQSAITEVKEILCACKKQLAFGYRVPPVIAMFDLANNHSYKNTAEFKIAPEAPKEEKREVDIQQIALNMGITLPSEGEG